MRFIQSVGHLKYTNPEIQISGICLQSSDIYEIKNSNIILTKYALEYISDYDLRYLTKNNVVYADPVDLKLDLHKLKKVDKVIASSNMQFQYLKNSRLKNIEINYHTTDFRIKNIKANVESFSIGYFGSLERLPKDLANNYEIQVIKTPLSYEPFRVLPIYSQQLWKYSAHLAVGTQVNNLVFKPFTKGLIASTVGAVTLISSKDEEAVSLLGRDYPYSVALKNEKSLKLEIDFMRRTFKRQEWILAVTKHQQLLRYCCEIQVLNKWLQILSYKK
jgi:hypothetical protein